MGIERELKRMVLKANSLLEHKPLGSYEEFKVFKYDPVLYEKRCVVHSLIFDKSIESSHKILQNHKRLGDSYILVDGNYNIVGTLDLRKKLRGYHLVNFGIVPSFRKMGLGSYFLHKVISQYGYNKKTITLGVYNDNEDAINTYSSLGFK